jgi:hypothetical protein
MNKQDTIASQRSIRLSGFLRRISASLRKGKVEIIHENRIDLPQEPGLHRTCSAYFMHLPTTSARQVRETHEFVKVLACSLGSFYLAWFLLARHPTFLRLLVCTYGL